MTDQRRYPRGGPTQLVLLIVGVALLATGWLMRLSGRSAALVVLLAGSVALVGAAALRIVQLTRIRRR